MAVDKEKTKGTIEILNMTCKGCARTIEIEMGKFEGIEHSVSFPDKSITVVYSPKDHNLEDF